MPKVEVFCKICGSAFMIWHSEIPRGRGRYCSRSCLGRAGRASLDQSGSKNPGWKGGISGDYGKYAKRFREKYPEKREAHKAVMRAINAGILEKKPCEVCDDIVRIHAHHKDYSRPLEVKWLCAKHHRMSHGKSC